MTKKPEIAATLARPGPSQVPMGNYTPEKAVERLFRLYRANGSPGYLADVFDLTAPELLRTANHLARDQAQAEDFLQSTFVEAIRSASRFEDGRRVIPWLSGILANVARDAHRKSQRLPHRSHVPHSNPIDPAQAVQDSELQGVIDREIDLLDEPYRTVMQLHVRSDHSPVEIARIVSRSPATVRSQLARARERLRERLPKEYAGALLVGLPMGRGLQSIRSNLVLRAYMAAPGIFFAARGMPPLAAQALIILAIVWAIDALAPGAAKHESEPSQDPITSAKDRVNGELPFSAQASTGDRSVASSGQVAGPSTASLRVHVTLRGEAMPGVGVRLQRGTDRDAIFDRRIRWTGQDGTASFGGLAAGAYRTDLDRARGPGVALTIGEDRTVEVDLGGGLHVQGVVRDSNGSPIPHAALWLARQGLAELAMASCRADAQGRFNIPGVQASYYLAAAEPGLQPSKWHAAADAENEPQLILVPCRPAATVRGTVRDARGRPIPNALIRLGQAPEPFWLQGIEGGSLRLVTQTAVFDHRCDAGGRYTIDHAPVGAYECFVRAPGYQGSRSTLTLHPGQEYEHVSTLFRGRPVSGEIREGERLLAGCLVEEAGGELGVPTWFKPGAISDGEGRYSLMGVTLGSASLQAWTSAGEPLENQVVLDPRGQASCDFDLAEHSLLLGQVLNSAGEPLRGLMVQTDALKQRGAVTDREGRFRLHVRPGSTNDLSIFDLNRRVPARMERMEGLTPGSEPWVLRVTDPGKVSAYLSGEVTSQDGTGLQNTFARIRHTSRQGWEEFPVDPSSGRYRMGPLIPGDYEVLVGARGAVARRWSATIQHPDQGRDLGVQRLQRGGTLSMDLRRDGEPYRGQVHMRVRGQAGSLLHQAMLVDPSLPTPTLPPGEVEVVAWAESLPIVRARGRVTAGENRLIPIDLPPSTQQRIRLEFPPTPSQPRERSMELTWSSDGIELTRDHYFFPKSTEPVVERLLAAGHYVVSAVTDGGLAGQATVMVPEQARDPVTVVLQLR